MKTTPKAPALVAGNFPVDYYLVIDPSSAILRHFAGFENYDDARKVSATHSGSVVTNCAWMRANFGSFAPLVRFVLPTGNGPLVDRLMEAIDYAATVPFNHP